MPLVAYSDESSDDEPAQKIIQPKRKIAFGRNKSFGIQLSMREKSLEQMYSKKSSEPIEDDIIDEKIPLPKIGQKRPLQNDNPSQPKSKSMLLNKLMSKKAMPSELKRLNDEERKSALEIMHSVNLEAEIDLEDSIAKAKSADTIFGKLEAAKIAKSEGKIDTDRLFIRSEYSAPSVGYGKVIEGQSSSGLRPNSNGKILGADKQSYTNRLQLSKGAVNVIQDDIAKNQKKSRDCICQIIRKIHEKRRRSNKNARSSRYHRNQGHTEK